jgi:membrane protein
VGLKDRLGSLPVIGTALAVQERYKLDAADPLAASIGFFAFLSIFPLLALAVSVAGFVLEDPEDQVAVAETITEAIPGFAATMEDDGDDTAVADLVENVVQQRGTIGLVGFVTLLIPGLKVVNGAMVATRVVFRGRVLKGIGIKLRQVGALFALGLLALLAAGASSVAGTGLGQLPGPVSLALSMGLTFLLDLALFLGAYTLLSPTSRVGVRDLWPGAVLGAIGWMALKVAGARYVGNQMDDANALYGALGGVIALMLLLYLAGRLYLYGAELAAVRYERQHGALVPPPADDDGDGGDEGGSSRAGAGRASERDTVPRGSSAAASSGGGTSRAGGPSSGTANGRRHQRDDGPPPVPRAARRERPVDPGPGGAAPTVGAATRERLADRTPGGSQGPGGEVTVGDPTATARAIDAAGSNDARQALALGLGLVALAAGWRWLRPGRQ